MTSIEMEYIIEDPRLRVAVARWRYRASLRQLAKTNLRHGSMSRSESNSVLDSS